MSVKPTTIAALRDLRDDLLVGTSAADPTASLAALHVAITALEVPEDAPTCTRCGQALAADIADRDQLADPDLACGPACLPLEVPPFLIDVIDEVARARRKFPGAAHLFVALGEEVGEAAEALLEHGNGSAELRAECVQVAAMAMRLAEEGDADFGGRTDG